jgi:large subunit ribosomal protein L17
MAVIELVEELSAVAKVVREAERARGTKVAPSKAPLGRTAEIAEDAKNESATAAGVAEDAAEAKAADAEAESVESDSGLDVLSDETVSEQAATEAPAEASTEGDETAE